MMPFGPKPVPEERWFESKSLAARLFIMIAGVVMNIMLAFVVLTGLGMSYGEVVVPTRVVGAVHVLTNAPALSALQAGDTIVSVNGVEVHNWNEVRERIDGAPSGDLRIQTQRGAVAIPVGGAGRPSAAEVGNAVDPFAPAVLGDVLPGSAASRGGLRPGDTLLTINHVPLKSWSNLREMVMPSSGKPLVFEIRRHGQAKSFTITPEPAQQKDPVTKQIVAVGQIGATPADFSSRQPMGFATAIREGGRQTWLNAIKIFDVVHRLVTREVSVTQLGGPIAITRASVAAAQSGVESLLWLIALLSVNVAVLNLMPIPILDGGQILINVAEAAKGRPFSARAKEYVLRVGLVAILLIFVVSTYNDLSNLVRDYASKVFG